MFNVRTNQKTKRILVAFGTMDKDTKEAIRQGFNELGPSLVRAGENNILNEPKQGREYPYYENGQVVRLIRASAKGQTPALRSGAYFEGLRSIPRGWQGLSFGNTEVYAEYLENGTPRMEKRPGLFNAIKSNLRNNQLYLQNSITKTLTVS